MGVYDGPEETGCATKYKMFWGTALTLSWPAYLIAKFLIPCKDRDCAVGRCLLGGFFLIPFAIVFCIIIIPLCLFLDFMFIIVFAITGGYCGDQCSECKKCCYVEAYTDPFECLD
eukprot:TRINITY_DN7856_c0_g1_i1.p1 TRINITY_DN7856_c0_g1~~TRINITY_DN7856_c0_g1_i1.p1  ORF type:complete len:115 (-),score=15.39 TRINITY_DN7856_c0_g1_i1:105-449(-)